MNKFWSKVDVPATSNPYLFALARDDCWEWMAGKHKIGYGRFKFRGKLWQAHRVAWTLAVGEIPEGLCVLHHCDNRACCNPDHLFLGTQQDNIADMVAKGRQRGALGNTNGAKITSDQVKEIRHLWSLGKMTQQAIGNMFGVTQHNISFIVNRINWVDVK
jgi:hypothetical protein